MTFAIGVVGQKTELTPTMRGWCGRNTRPAPDPARREEEMSRAFKPYTDMEKIACAIGYHFWHPDSRYHAWQLGKDAAREVMSWLKSPDSDDAFPDEPTPSTGDQQSRGGDAT